MTERETDAMDRYGQRLGRELYGLSARALEPVDAAAVAHRVAVAKPRSRRAFPLDGVMPRSLPRTVLVVVLAASLLLVALIGFDLLAGAAVTKPSPIGKGIAFVHVTYDSSGRDGPSEPVVLFAPTDGGNPRFLAGIPGGVPPTRGDPLETLAGPRVTWSPDGTRLAFRLFNDLPGIYVMPADGGDLRRVVELDADRDTAAAPPQDRGGAGGLYSAPVDWSPDGSRIAYTYPYWDDRSDLYVVNVRDGRVTNLTEGPDRWATRTVAWSPDGSRIAFARTESNVHSGLFVMNADGTGERRVPDEALVGHVDAIAWAPDGSRIAFVRREWPAVNGGPRWMVETVNLDGTGLRDLWISGPSDNGGFCCDFRSYDKPFSWSPRGDLIAVGGRDAITLFDVSGSGPRELMKGTFFDWSPDGSRLVVSGAGVAPAGPGLDPYSLYLINADGTDRAWLANGEYPAWRPAPAK